MYACTIEVGEAMSELDVCKTPMPPAGEPVPIPYPNIAMTMTGEPAAETILIEGAPALNLGSEMLPTQGDEAGIELGIVSELIMGAGIFVHGSDTVMLEGLPSVRLTDPTLHNEANCEGTVLVPSQETVLVNS